MPFVVGCSIIEVMSTPTPPLRAFGQEWIPGREQNPRASLTWWVFNLVGQGGIRLSDRSALQAGRIHKAAMEKTGFYTHCGRTINLSAFSTPAPRGGQRPTYWCGSCWRTH